MKDQYFPSLDGLRFVAAATVVLSHFETIKQSVQMPYVHNRFFDHSASIAVTFFFVLSGFLIFWWLHKECKGDLSRISLRKFYIYRISRTWPLYFLVFCLSLAFTFLNNSIITPEVVKRFVSYFLLLPNTADVLYGMDIYLGPAWSLGVEECFYLFFPLLLLKCASRFRVERLLLGAAIVWILLSAVFNPIAISFLSDGNSYPSFLQYLCIFFERYRFYSFFLGAFMAWVVINKERFKYVDQLANSPYLVSCFSLVLLLLFLGGITFNFLTHQVYSVLFSVFIGFMTLKRKPFPILVHPILRLGGTISYGIYLLHMLLVVRLCNQLSFLINADCTVVSLILSWLMVLGLIMLLAFLVYRYFEKPVMLWLRGRYLEKGSKVRVTHLVPFVTGMFKKPFAAYKG